MKILIVNRLMGILFGGGETTDFNAAKYLTKRGHQVTILTSEKLFSKSTLALNKVRVVKLKTPYLRGISYKFADKNNFISAFLIYLDLLIFEIISYFWIIENNPKNNFDIIQNCSLFNLPILILNTLEIPCISWLPGPPSNFQKYLIKKLMKNKKFSMFTRGAPVQSLIEMGYLQGKEFYSIPPGIDFNLVKNNSLNESLKSKYKINKNIFVGFTSARLVNIKNHRMILDALKLAKNKRMKIKWIFAGDGPLELSLKEYASELKIQDDLIWLGQIKKEKVHEILNIVDVVAITSFYENYSNAVLEAFAHKVPVIGTNVGYLKELIRISKAGITIESNKPADMVDAIKKLKDDKFRNLLGDNGEKFASFHDWERVTLDLENLYRKII